MPHYCIRCSSPDFDGDKTFDGRLSVTVIDVLRILADSACDFPGAMGTLGLSDLFGDGDPTMWPNVDEALILYNAMNFQPTHPEINNNVAWYVKRDFVRDFLSIDWDT